MNYAAIILTTSAVLVTAAVYAGAKHQHEHGHSGKIERILNHVNATEEQRGQIEVIIDEIKAQLMPLRDQSLETRKSLREQFFGESFDEQAVASLADTQGDLVTQKIILMAQVKNRVYSLLDTQQRELLTKMLEKHSSRKSGRHHRQRWLEMPE